MTYNTPELLLVGAAQNFVLGTDPQKIEFERNADTPGERVYLEESLQVDQLGW